MSRTSLQLARLLFVVAPAAIAFSIPSDRRGPQAVAQSGSYVPAETWHSAAGPLAAGSFRVASGIALAPDGRAFVSDAQEARISVIEVDESVGVLVGGGGASALSAPAHLAVDAAASRLYVADPGGRRIDVFDLSGAPLGTWPVGGRPSGIEVAPDGSVVVADADSGQVIRFAADGQRLANWQATPGQPGGGLLGGLDVGADGRVYVVLGREARLRVFSAQGALVDQVAVNPPGLPTTAVDIDVDSDPRGTGPDIWWLASTRGLLLYEPARRVWTVNPLGADLTAVVADRTRGVYVSFQGTPPLGGRVIRLPYATAALSGAGRSWSGTLLQPGTFVGPEDVTVGADGRAYVIDRWPRVQRYAADGTPLGQVDRLEPAAVTAGADGALFVTDGGALQAFGPSDWLAGRPTSSWSVAMVPSRNLANAVALGVDRSSGTVVALDALGNAVRRFTPAGSVLPAVSLSMQTTSKTLWSDMDVLPDGTLYVLDRGSDSVHVLPNAGPPRALVVPDGSRRLAAEASGAFFTLGRDGWVRRYDAVGALTTAFDATRFDLAPSSSPSDLAVMASDVLVSDREAGVVTRFRWDPSAAPGTPPAHGAACRAYPGKTTSPSAVMLGQEVEVRLTVRGGCGSDTTSEPLDVLLVLDRSGSMDEERLRLMQAAAMDFIAEVDFALTRVGIVSFAEAAKLEVGLTDDPVRLRQALAGLQVGGTTSIDRGLQEARAELGRRGRARARPVFIVLSDGGSDFDAAKHEADLAKAQGVEIYAVGIQAWARLMREIATDEAHYFQADSNRFLFGVFAQIAERVTTTTLFRSILVTDVLPANMRYVAGSAEPAATYHAASRTLTWQLNAVPFTGFSLRYRVAPLEFGDWPANVAAWGDYVDGFDTSGRLDFPVPRVEVLRPTPQPVTPSATPTASRTPTAAPTFTPTATREPFPLFLPLALREQCHPGQKPADIVLVMDTSSSMEGEKLQAAKQAASAFIGLLPLATDRLALVSFHDQAQLESPLSHDAAHLRQILERLTTAPGTRIDLGLAAAVAELEAADDRAGRTGVIVVLTDGRQDDADMVLAQADRARQAGVILFAVGLGDDVDRDVLTRIAGSNAQTYLAPRPADLAAIYARIAVLYPCPPETYWPLR